ncbi:prepilin peptidase [Gemmatimonas sp.]|uniref:A24 family peptidase n=2 Tax=Gemmatimonas sp. TaxID=1962908 RepID=UPI00286D9FCA|nr:prepilin peptidase [Gemmatimonas sp.]
MISSTSSVLFFAVVLGTLLAGAVISDLRERRVSNVRNLGVFVTGVLASVLMRGAADGMWQVLSGVGLALAIWFPMFALRLMGAGDVKLMAASAAWLGWQGTLVASLATGIYGGLLGAFWLLRSHGAVSALNTVATAVRAPWIMKLRPYEARDRVPYALAIAAGVATAFWISFGSALRSAHS